MTLTLTLTLGQVDPRTTDYEPVTVPLSASALNVQGLPSWAFQVDATDLCGLRDPMII